MINGFLVFCFLIFILIFATKEVFHIFVFTSVEIILINVSTCFSTSISSYNYFLFILNSYSYSLYPHYFTFEISFVSHSDDVCNILATNCVIAVLSKANKGNTLHLRGSSKSANSISAASVFTFLLLFRDKE